MREKVKELYVENGILIIVVESGDKYHLKYYNSSFDVNDDVEVEQEVR